MTPAELQQAIEANAAAIDRLTSAVETLVSSFIRPAVQQAQANYERLDRFDALMNRHAEVIAQTDLKLDRVAEQQDENAQQIAANAQQIAANAQQIAANAQQIETTAEGMEELRSLNQENQRSLQILIEEGRADRQAQREALREIRSNTNRIDRLDQQAS